MDLKNFYFQNIKNDEYHYRFYDSIKNSNKRYNIFLGEYEIDDIEFVVYDTEEAILKFRELCQPETGFYDNENTYWFYLITYYLYKMGYEIKEFPRILARPPKDPTDFVYKEIRTRIISQGGDFNGTVRYATRRTFVANLTFEIKSNHIEISDSIDQKFAEISNRQAPFNNMSTDEKLAEIANLIENMLKKDGKFVSLDYSTICYDYIDNENVKKYRHKLQCFRHSAEDSIKERETFSNEQKSFLIDYGLMIIKVIYNILFKPQI
ncbi:MAG: hypothetical protein UE295_01800 [Acutalibacteraceae bacterium]|nr:hypothetical protein [Acutalibacteraceae bacterium]